MAYQFFCTVSNEISVFTHAQVKFHIVLEGVAKVFLVQNFQFFDVTRYGAFEALKHGLTDQIFEYVDSVAFFIYGAPNLTVH